MDYNKLINAFKSAGFSEEDAWTYAYEYRNTIELLGDTPVETASQADYDEGVLTDISYWEL